MKRFWKTASAVPAGEGWSVELDGKPIRTPERQPLVVSTQALAEAIAGEWNAAGETVDPTSMPFTGLANAAIDRVAADRQGFAAGLARYGESDLLCYRAASPRELAERQAALWDPLIAWSRRRFDIDIRTACGVIHVAQTDPTVQLLAHRLAVLDPFRLAGLSPLVTIGGSLVAALAVLEGAVGAEPAWEAVTVDERWQARQWGEDEEEKARLEARQRDFLAAARFLELLG